MRLAAFALCLLTPTFAAAQDLTVQFADGAPKDSITLQNNGCDLRDAMLILDLAGSSGDLIFDVTSGGAGVEVFQPVEITSGYAALSPVQDGDKQLQIFISALDAGETLGLTADLDDTLEAGRQITVSGSEMAGASMSLALSDRVVTGTFDSAGIAKIDLPANASVCLAAAG